MIGVIDYGLGNVMAFLNAYDRMQVPATHVRIEEDLSKCSKLILPGVGSFDHAIMLLEKSGIRHGLEQKVLREKRPILGVCVGMQMLAESSEEGALRGLGWIDGVVRRIPTRLPVPHMGWNDVRSTGATGLFRELEIGSRFYFLHSYYFECASMNNAIAETEYGSSFCCAVRKENIYGVQFHPEKSHHWGMRLLKNFAEL